MILTACLDSDYNIIIIISLIRPETTDVRVQVGAIPLQIPVFWQVLVWTPVSW